MLCLVLATFLLTIAGHSDADKCEDKDLKKCTQDVRYEDFTVFNITSSQAFKDDCETKLKATKCLKKYVSKCISTTEMDFFNLNITGKFQTVEGACEDGGKLNAAFLKYIDCSKKMEKDVELCYGKVKQSYKKISHEDSLDEQLKAFHGCCAIEWLKKCKGKAVEANCDSEAKLHVAMLSDIVEDEALKMSCIPKPSKCGGLYGVEEEKKMISSGPMLKASAVILFLSLLFM